MKNSLFSLALVLAVLALLLAAILHAQIIPTQPLPTQWVDQSKSNALRLLSTTTGPRFQVVRGRSQQNAIDVSDGGWTILNGLVTRYGGGGGSGVSSNDVVAVLDLSLMGTAGYIPVFTDTNKIGNGRIYQNTNGALVFISQTADTGSVMVVVNVLDQSKSLLYGVRPGGNGYVETTNGTPIEFSATDFRFTGTTITLSNNSDNVTLRFVSSNHTATVAIDTASGQVEVISDNGVVVDSGIGSMLIKTVNGEWQFFDDVLTFPRQGTSLGVSPDSDAYMRILASDPSGYSLLQFANTNGGLTTLVGSSPFGALLSTSASQMDLGVSGRQLNFTANAFGPTVSNLVDSGTANTPWRTNYSGAFTVVGSRRTVAYADGSHTVWLDADAFKVGGTNGVTTNLSIAGVATLKILNGIIVGVTGP